MSNCYIELTIHQSLPKKYFSANDLEILKEQGYSYYGEDDNFWFYCDEFYTSYVELEDESGISYEVEEKDLKIFQRIIREDDNIKEIICTGCWYGDGEPGGFVWLINKENVLQSSTEELLTLMRNKPELFK